MKHIITETEVTAYNYLKEFGFSEVQVDALIMQGKKDLYNELTKLKILLDTDAASLDDINNVLHALKGLFFQLGNHDVAEKLNDIRSESTRETILKEISELLFIAK